MLLTGGVALVLFLGAKINQFLTNPPLADLSEIKFRFSRKEESAMPVVDVFFVTNRRPVAGRSGEFENGAGGSLSYGIAQIRMPAQLRVGDIQMPDIPRKIIDNQHAVILDVSVLTPEKFRAELSDRLTRLNSRTFDLFIHGINHSFDSAVRQAGTLSFDLDMPQPMVVFAWPTTPGILPGNYQSDLEQVTPASRQLANFLEAFQQDVHPEYMNVIAHSLGCKVACQTFDLIVREPAWQNDETKLSNIVLAAPDVSREDFDKT
ncbi:MAG: alpha/beta hydrolase, partial [Terrimicrobiaceae bacterium]